MSKKDRLLLDAMLGKLSTYLRMCGYDVRYAHEEELEADEKIKELAERENRLLVTRDRQLASRTDGALLLESKEIEAQLRELVAAGFEMSLPEEPRRCSVCNGRVRALAGDESRPEHAPDDVADIWQCRDCGQYFWKGSHWDRVTETLSEVESRGSGCSK